MRASDRDPTARAARVRPFRVLGVDPGLANLGLGVVEEERREARLVASELVTTSPRMAQAERLLEIRVRLQAFVTAHAPHALAIESQFLSRQRDVSFRVGQAVGVVLLTAAELGLSVHEYGPSQVKQALVGTGRADKAQVAFMVRALLKLPATPRSDHVADALALALTHLQSRRVPG